MAYVFFRIPEDSNLWAEGPRAKVFPSRELNRASGCFPGVAGRGRGVTAGGEARPQPAGGWAPCTEGCPEDTPPLAAARPCSSSGSWNLPDPAVFPALRAGS